MRRLTTALAAGWLIWFGSGCAGSTALRAEGQGPSIWSLPPFPDFQMGPWVAPDGTSRPDVTFFTMPGEDGQMPPVPYSVWSREADLAMAAYLEEVWARFEGNAAALRALGGRERPEPGKPKADGAEAHEVSSGAVATPSGGEPEPVATVWPQVWSPDGHKEIGREERRSGDWLVAVVRYDDGTEVVLVKGRPYSVDPKPRDPCAPFWRDRAMLGANEEAIPEAEWTPAVWEERASQSPLCPGA